MQYLPSKKFIVLIASILLFGAMVFVVSTLFPVNNTFIQKKESARAELVQSTYTDSDDDGLKDWEEWLWGTNPLVQDTNNARFVQKTPTTQENLKKYGNALADILKKYSNITAERALKEFDRVRTLQDAESVRALEYVAANYYALGTDIGTLPIPEEIYPVHIQIIKNMETIAESIEYMKTVARDEESARKGLDTYIRTLETTTILFAELYNVFAQSGVSFEENEPGYLWYKFQGLNANL